MTAPERQDLDAPYWTISQAAKHFGFTRATIEKYIREGLPTYFSGVAVKPAEVIAERLRRQGEQRSTRIVARPE